MRLSRWQSYGPVVLSLGLALGCGAAEPAAPVATAVHSELDQPLTALPYTPGLQPASMDKTVDPCVDFYAYSCGGWQKSNPIPADQGYTDVYSKLRDQIRRYLWGTLLAVARPRPERTVVEQQLGDYFAACMDEAAIDARGATPLEPALRSLAAVKNRTDLSAWLVEQQLLAHGDGLLFSPGDEQDVKNPSQVIAALTPGGIGLPDRDDYLDDDATSVELRARYQEHVAKMLGLLGDSPEQAKATAMLVLRLETELARAMLTRVERRIPDNTYHPMTIDELRALVPALVWDVYAGATRISRDSRIDITEPRFFRALDQVLEREPLDDIKRYLRWHLVSDHASDLSRAFVDEDFDFYGKHVRGAERLSPRWTRCVRFENRDLQDLVAQLFVKQAFSPAAKSSAQQMLHAIEKEMENALQEGSWMSASTRAEALSKLHQMGTRIGYPEEFRDYSTVKVSRNDFYANVSSLVRVESLRQLAKIGRPVDRDEWAGATQDLDGSYHDALNTMEFGAGILQPPLFDPKMDAAPNYGDTGGMMGHELVHGFDDNGRRFDAHGMLRDWWTKQDGEEFDRRTRCVSDQFSSYVAVDDVHVNGELTLGENVADLSGLILAYRAWKTVTAGTPLAPIDGLTPAQRFFVGYAQWTCTNVRPETARNWARTDPHAPNVYRVNGLVVNVPEFAQAFQCRTGQPMVKPAAQVCKVW